MANFAFVRVGGVWGGSTVLLSSEMAAFDAIRPKLINASEGSTHAPSAPIIIGGSGIDITGPAILNDIRDAALTNGGVFVLQNGTSIDGQSGSDINVSGALSIESGGAATVQSGGTLAWSGATNWPLLSSRTITRNKWGLAWTTYASTPPASPRAWFEEGQSGGGQALQTSAETTARSLLIEVFELPPGATIVSVVLKTEGSGGTDNLPVYTPVKWQGSSVKTSIGTTTADAHNAGNWTSSIIDTTVPCTAGLSVVDSAYHYGVSVSAPWDAGSAAALTIYDVTVNLTTTKIQL